MIEDIIHTRKENGDHKFELPYKITKEQSYNLQTQLGYHPAGYSHYGFEVTDNSTIWYCWNSCD